MKVHHLDCGTMCPLGAKLLPGVFPKRIVSHCLLIEHGHGLILVDTGFGLKDIEGSTQLGWTGWALAPLLDPAQTAYRQIERMGLSPADVTDVIPTHLDLDHAGGIQDFPSARVHVAKAEQRAATRREGIADWQRYRPRQLPAHGRWREFEMGEGEKWFGFDAVRPLPGLSDELLLIDLPGHTAGHTGVAVSTEGGWLLHVGDAYYHRNEIEAGAEGSVGLSLFQWLVHSDYETAMATRRGLSALTGNERVRVICSHDPTELRRAQQREGGG